MKMRKTALLLPGLLVSALAAAAAGPVPTMQIAGMVTDAATGAPVAGATVAVLDKVALTDDAGRYTLPGLPRTHEIAFRVYVEAPPPPPPAAPSDELSAAPPAGLPVPPPVPKTYWVFRDFTAPTPFLTAAAVGPAPGADAGKVDIQVVALGEGDAQVDFAIREAGPDVNAFCLGCHPADERGPLALGPDPEIPAPVVDAVFYRAHRFEDVHPVGLDIKALIEKEQARNPLRAAPAAPLAGGRVITCDSCHTRHLPTPYGRYVIAEFAKGNALCFTCHE